MKKRENGRLHFSGVSLMAKILPALFLCVGLSGCRDGQVDEGCHWGPIPNEHKLELLKARGIRTIILCRLNPMKGEEEKAHKLGLNFVHIPCGLFVAPPEEGIKKFLSVVRDPAMRPVYICDQVARDRTQFYAGIYGMVSQNWSADTASWQMYRNGLRHWWPWFYKFHRIIQNDEQEIHGETALKNNSPLKPDELAPQSNNSLAKPNETALKGSDQVKPD